MGTMSSFRATLDGAYTGARNLVEVRNVGTADRERQRVGNSSVWDEVAVEILLGVMSNLTQKELLTMRAVCKGWRDVLGRAHRLWHHLDISIFKPEFRDLGIKLMVSLSARSLRSIDYTDGYGRSLNGLFAEVLQCCTQIEEIRAFSLSLWSVIPRGRPVSGPRRPRLSNSPAFEKPEYAPLENVKLVEIRGRTTNGLTVDILSKFPNIQELIINDLESQAFHDWKVKDTCDTLTSMQLRWSAPRIYRRDRFITLRRLAEVAPNLTTLHCENWTIPEDNTPAPWDNPGFNFMSNLTTLILEDLESESFMLESFPPSLEFLVMRMKEPGFRNVVPMRRRPRLPRLKHLHINFDGMEDTLVSTPDDGTIWQSILKNSGCMLQTLRIEDRTGLNLGLDIGNIGNSRGWLDVWAPSVVSKMCKMGLLSDLGCLELWTGERGQLPDDDRDLLAHVYHNELMDQLEVYCRKLQRFIWAGACSVRWSKAGFFVLKSPLLQTLFLENGPQEIRKLCERRGVDYTTVREEDRRKCEQGGSALAIQRRRDIGAIPRRRRWTIC